MALVIQSFGKESEYRRAIVTIVSYYAWSKPENVQRTILFTDNPDYFRNWLAGFAIEFVLLTPEKIKIMRGDIDFLHRMKIALIEEAFGLSREHVVYADSDTFFISDPSGLVSQLSERKSFMHELEYRFDTLKEMKLPAGKPFHAFYDLISTKTFLGAHGSTIPVSIQHNSWNAGVMFLHASHTLLLPDVYKLTEQFYPPTQNHASEQYAFSVVLQNRTEIQPCFSVIYHYWYRVKKQIMDKLLAQWLDESWRRLSNDEKKTTVRKWTKLLPGVIENHVWLLRDNAIQAFHEKRTKTAFGFALRAVSKNPFNLKFLRDVLYHVRKLLVNG